MSRRYQYPRSVFFAAALIALSFSRAAATNITACGTFGAGSYMVATNITSVGVNCLTFTAGPVTLELNGFTVSGSGSASTGVFANNIANVTVRNGTLQGFARDIFATGAGTVIDRVRGVTGSASAFWVGNSAIVENSYITGHGAGITAGRKCTIVGNIITGNNGNMITVSDGSTVKGNTVTENTGNSVSAIQITQNCKVVDNVIANSSFGVSATGPHNIISGNTISATVEGIQVGDDTIITGNNSSHNSDNGIEAGADCVISNNDLSDNTGVGVTSDVGTLFLNNVANGNGNIGIHVNSGGSAIGNVANNNATGLEVGCPAKVDNNTATGNSSTNLSTSGSGCLLSNNLAP